MINTNNAIEVKGMSKRFKAMYDKPNTLKERLIFWRKKDVQYHEVLKDISLDIKKGETVALIGTNGSGKSTLLKLMTKILYPSEGEVNTNGKLTSLLELGAGFHPDFTGRENIYFNASIFGLTRKEIDSRVQDIIDFSELKEFIDSPVRTYSSGMYMRLAFSVAINVDADILLIDEILAVGDQHFQDKCFAKLEELRDSDKTIVIVSHSLDLIKKLCTRAIWIYEGEFKGDGTPSQVIDAYLEQVVLDHEVEEEPEELKGTMHIDYPQQEAYISKDKKIAMYGWEVSNVKETEVKVFIDNKEIAIATREKRPDIMMNFQDSYGGPSLNTRAGWRAIIDTTKLVGEQLLQVKVFTKDGQVLSEKIVAVHVQDDI